MKRKSDQPRSISRFASDAPEHRVASGKMLALMNCALTGTLYIYQGQEIGMVNCPEDWELDDYLDVDAINYVKQLQQAHEVDADALVRAKQGIRKLIVNLTKICWNSDRPARTW